MRHLFKVLNSFRRSPLDKSQTPQEIEKGTRYILNAMPEEIWFWTSKLLDDEINLKALEAPAILSGSIHLNNSTSLPSEQTTKQTTQLSKGAFWPIVR